MTKNIYKIGLCISLLLGMLACNEDLGNYDYRAVNQIEISGIKESYEVEPGQTLEIRPILQFSEEEDNPDLSYLWLCYYKIPNPNTHEIPDTLSREQDLILPMVGKWAKPNVNPYLLIYEVKNNKTGATYYWDSGKSYAIGSRENPHRISVKVQNSYAMGYLALTEKAQGFGIDMIAYNNGGLKSFLNLLDMVDSELPRGGDTIGLDIQAFIDHNSPVRYDEQRYAVYVLSNKLTTRLNPADYMWSPDYNLSHTIVDNPDKNLLAEKMVSRSGSNNPNNPKMNGMNVIQHIYSGGNWYFLSNPVAGTMPSWYFFDAPINRLAKAPGATEFPAPYKTVPYIAVTGKVALLWNDDTKQFLLQRFWDGTEDGNPTPDTPDATLSTQSLPKSQASLITFQDNNPTPHELVYMGSDGFAILKDANNVYKFAAFTINEQNKNLVAPFRRGILTNSAVNWSQVKIWFLSNDKKYLFYSDGTKLLGRYIADIASTGNPIANMTTELDFTSAVTTPEYPNISCIKILTGHAGNKYIVVGTYSDTLPKGANGKMTLLKFDETEGKFTSTGNSFTGLGKVISVTYKQK